MIRFYTEVIKSNSFHLVLYWNHFWCRGVASKAKWCVGSEGERFSLHTDKHFRGRNTNSNNTAHNPGRRSGWTLVSVISFFQSLARAHNHNWEWGTKIDSFTSTLSPLFTTADQCCISTSVQMPNQHIVSLSFLLPPIHEQGPVILGVPTHPQQNNKMQ